MHCLFFILHIQVIKFKVMFHILGLICNIMVNVFLCPIYFLFIFLTLFLASLILTNILYDQSFPDSSVGKESTCNAGDPSSIPGLGKSAGEGIGYPFQYSWASLVPQLVKNPPEMWEIWVRSLGWEDPLDKGKATHSSILAQRIPWTFFHYRKCISF